MKKAILALTVLATFGCQKEETTCTQKVYKKDGANWVLINSNSWNGLEQYKNYTKTIWYEDGTFDVIKTTVICD